MAQAASDQQPPFSPTSKPPGGGPGAVKGGISGASEPLTARTAAQDVNGEKGAALERLPCRAIRLRGAARAAARKPAR